jgi:hypothetical protein
MKPITLDSIVKKNDNIFTGTIDNEMVAISIQSGKYYQLNKTGSRILALLDHPHSVRELCEAIQTKYKIESDVCQDDILEFMKDMANKNLILTI